MSTMRAKSLHRCLNLIAGNFESQFLNLKVFLYITDFRITSKNLRKIRLKVPRSREAMSSETFSHLSKLGFNVSKQWLDACYEYCREQNPGFSSQALINAVIEQWKNADITVEGVQAWPRIKINVSPDVAKGPPLQGKFLVQVSSRFYFT